MADFEAGPLANHTPCRYSSLDDVVNALAMTHVELLLIHPFRDGNGRTARVLSVLMALQANLPIFDFRVIKGKKRNEYLAAVREGLNSNYEPTKRIFDEVIE